MLTIPLLDYTKRPNWCLTAYNLIPCLHSRASQTFICLQIDGWGWGGGAVGVGEVKMKVQKVVGEWGAESAFLPNSQDPKTAGLDHILNSSKALLFPLFSL